MEEFVKDVLEPNEKVLCVLRPNKTKFMFSSFLWTFLGFAMAVILGVVLLFVADEIVSGIIALGVTLLVCTLAMLYCAAFYKTCYYAITDKKIIIRSGVFGVDYKTLNLDQIGSIHIDVTAVDKLVGKNTGTVTIMPSSGMVVNSESVAGYGFKFAHIENPYEFYRKAKELTSK